MQFIKALFSHVWLVMRMKHDGTGLPVNFIGAFLLVSIYIALVIINKSIQKEMTLEVVLALGFIGQFYLFSIRNTVIGLILLIGIIGNLLSLAMAAFGAFSTFQVVMLAVMESVLIMGALINIIKTHSKVL